MLSELLSEDPQYDAICEIGTGNGMYLDYLAKELPKLKSFTGLDINGDQINEKILFYNQVVVAATRSSPGG